MIDPVTIPSPDGILTAILNYLGEIRFGPPYYSLAIDKRILNGRYFGASYLWSPDSRYFAIQEWETISEGRGPQTQLLLIDVETQRECAVSKAENGFIVPLKFEKNKLIYRKDYFAPRATQEYEIEFLTLNRWENLK